MKSGILSLATLATCSRCSRMCSSIVRPGLLHSGSSAVARVAGGGRGTGTGDGDEQRPPPPARPKPWGNRPREGGPELGAGLICTRSRKRKLGKLQKKEAWGGPAGCSELRGGQANSARRSAAPGAAAAGVRCNKQLATQTPGPCCAGAGRGATRCLSGFVVRARAFTRPFPLDYSSLLMSSQGGWAAEPRCTRNARFRGSPGTQKNPMVHIGNSEPT